MLILNVHNVLGTLVVLVSIAAIFWLPARRVVLYVLVLQIIVGGAVWGLTKIVPPLAHWLLAILNGGTYAMANVFEKRGRPRGLVIGMLVLGAAIFILVYSLGMHAAKTSHLLG
jgi:hypothetical protein